MTVGYVSTSVYLFPVMVQYNLGAWNVVRNAFLISLSQFGTTLLCLLIIAVAAVLYFVLPPAAMVGGSGTASLLYFLCRRAFRRVEALKDARR